MSNQIIRAIALAIAALERNPGNVSTEARANTYVRYIKNGGMS